ncbi:MAG: hypothetical protein IJ055_02635, partial [Oscillospiraceae bacterium]|nr:hypothetical protein [Oscillospiraceae bacterium]
PTEAPTDAPTDAPETQPLQEEASPEEAPMQQEEAPMQQEEAPAPQEEAPPAQEEVPAAPEESVQEAAEPEYHPVEAEQNPDVSGSDDVVTGTVTMSGGCMVVDSGSPNARAIELFYGSYDTGTRFAWTLNDYKARLGDNVNVFCMVVPTSQAYYTPTDVAGQYGSQLDHYNNIAGNLSGVTGVPVFSALQAHRWEYLYSRTDYHWQPLAAYYAGEQFAACADVPYASLDTYESVSREGYVGAFYTVNHISELQNAPDTFTYYKPANLDILRCTYYDTNFTDSRESTLFFESNSLTASYTVFVGRDDCILQVDTDVENGRTLVIFKDSYGNALVPFLTQSFSRIYLCDFRYFDRNAVSFMQEVGATDLLFAMSTVACTTSAKVDKVAENLTK